MSEIEDTQLEGPPLIIKVGGGESINMEGIIRDLATEPQPIIVVLGANSTRDRLAEKLDMPTQMIQSVSGYDSVYTDQNAIDLIMMTYAGVARNRFVECCQRHGINAVGLSGLDGRLIQGERNRGIRVRENSKTLIKRDFSGKPRQINGNLLRLLLGQGYTPVLSIPIVDADGFAINADNDNIISALHRELDADRIYQFIEAPGLLADPDQPSSLIHKLSVSDVQMREDSASGRMKRKLLAIRQLFDEGYTQVIISDGRTETPYLDAVGGIGTVIG